MFKMIQRINKQLRDRYLDGDRDTVAFVDQYKTGKKAGKKTGAKKKPDLKLVRSAKIEKMPLYLKVMGKNTFAGKYF